MERFATTTSAVPLSGIVRSTYFDGLDIVPGNLELMEFEHDTPKALVDGEGEAFFGRVATALGEIAERYDVMILDCPPQLGFLTLGALCAATSVLITVHPQMLDVMSMCQFLLMALICSPWFRRLGPTSTMISFVM